MTVEVDQASWSGLLSRYGCNDTYYSASYLEAAAVAHSGRPVFLHAETTGGAVAFPCVVRELVDAPGRDVTTVAPGGPLAFGPEPPLSRFTALYEEWCERESVVTTFVRFHPLYANQRYAPGFFHLERTEGAVTWPLHGDLLAGMHRHHRRLVRKAEAHGIDVRLTPGPDRLDDFRRLYEETMERLDASPFYFFPDAYWDCLVAGLRHQTLLLEAQLDGVTIAAVLCFTSSPWLHYHLGATSDHARRLGASHLLLYRAALFGSQHGFEQFHLGSGVGTGGGSLLEFKQRFSPVPLIEQWLGKAVHDAERYRALTGSPAIDLGGFFPAYRRNGDRRPRAEVASRSSPVESSNDAVA